MMISEKTVELNLSMELINHINYWFKSSVFAIAPTQRSEGNLGYDVKIPFGVTSGILIQYKRAIPNGNEYQYHINYTKHQRQHQILLDAERAGFNVLYALPLFHTVRQIVLNRRRLLRETEWYRPSQITWKGGPLGKSILHIDRTTKNYYTASERTDISSPLKFSEVNKVFQQFKQNKLRTTDELIIFLNDSVKREKTFLKNELENDYGELSQQFILSLGDKKNILTENP